MAQRAESRPPKQHTQPYRYKKKEGTFENDPSWGDRPQTIGGGKVGWDGTLPSFWF